MPPHEPYTVRAFADLVQRPLGTVRSWIRAGKLTTTAVDGHMCIAIEPNREFIIKLSNPLRAPKHSEWNPRGIAAYSRWHDLLDGFVWLLKVCYSDRATIKGRRFRLDHLFVSYLNTRRVTLKKLRTVFKTNMRPKFKDVAADLKRGWYNELAFATPVRPSTLDLSMSAIGENCDASALRLAFPSWPIIQSYYAVYFL